MDRKGRTEARAPLAISSIPNEKMQFIHGNPTWNFHGLDQKVKKKNVEG